VTSILLEDVVAIENLPEILEVDGIDVFWVVPGDLAQSLGYTGQTNHPEVRAVMDKAIDDIVKAGRRAGTLVNDDTIEDAIAKGVSMVSVSWTNWLAAGARGFLSKVEKAGRT